MRVTASQLRADVYRILDRALGGEAVEIERGGRILRIVADEPPDRLAKLIARDDYVAVDPEELVHCDWSDEWKP